MPFTEEVWNSWLEPVQAVRILICAGLDDREQAINWLKGRLRGGALRAGGWHVELLPDDPLRIKSRRVVGLYKLRTWDNVAAIPWKDDFWVSGEFQPDDPLDVSWRTIEESEFRHFLERVRFDPAPIEEFCRRATMPLRQSKLVNVEPPKPVGGRPPKPFWDLLWASVAAGLYNGDLKPERQADIERAMHDWLVANDYEAGETAVRAKAKLLWDAIRSEVGD